MTGAASNIEGAIAAEETKIEDEEAGAATQCAIRTASIKNYSAILRACFNGRFQT